LARDSATKRSQEVDEQGFVNYMKKQNKSVRTIRRYATFFKNYEDFLTSRGKSLQDTTPEDLHAYVDYGESKYRPFSLYLNSIKVYYEFASNKRMRWTLDEIDYPGDP
jgi:site-specific recombinase XerD